MLHILFQQKYDRIMQVKHLPSFFSKSYVWGKKYVRKTENLKYTVQIKPLGELVHPHIQEGKRSSFSFLLSSECCFLVLSVFKSEACKLANS